MKLNIYTIHDMATGSYSKPFFGQADGEATRNFSDFAQDADSFVGKHPEDYTLYRIGTFDDQKAEINPEKISKMATALEVIAVSRNVNKDNIEKLDRTINKAVPANAGRYQ